MLRPLVRCALVLGLLAGAAAPPAHRARALVADPDLLLDPGRDLLKGQLEMELEIVPAPRAGGTTASREEVVEASFTAEVAHEGTQGVGEVEAAEVESPRRRHALGSGVAEPIVLGPLLGIVQHLVGFGRLLEALLGGLVPGIAVWVVLQCQLAIRALDFLVGGLSRQPEHLVAVASAHALATFTIAGRSSLSPST